jgi:RNA polymerase sigma factor (sigma-70 family)
MSPETVAEALRRSSRDPEAFVQLYDEHAEALLAYLARRIYDPEIAFDLTAETFAQAYAARGRFRGSTDAAAAAWLYKIAKRQFTRYLRKGGAERRALARLGIEPPGIDDEQRARIEELADLEALRRAVRVELARLSEAQRDALELKVVEEHSYPEVASRLGISEEAARARVSRGLRALAAGLDRGPRAKETRA